MKRIKLQLTAFLLFIGSSFAVAQDWANLEEYSSANSKVSSPYKGEDRVVFMGNSITAGWVKKSPEFFNENPFIGRGISGQVTSQMLLRFRNDVINLEPSVVVILAGINDIAGNKGDISIENIAGNIISMAELAKANEIKVVLCSVLPAAKIPWRDIKNTPEKVLELNSLIQAYAEANRITYVDYYSKMVDKKTLGLPTKLAKDGIHPTEKGYSIMEPIVLKGIKKALRHRL